jgi:hypothetical protein
MPRLNKPPLQPKEPPQKTAFMAFHISIRIHNPNRYQSTNFNPVPHITFPKINEQLED